MEGLKHFWDEHPILSNWIILAVGMVIILYFSARHVGFLPGQWAALVGATLVLAGLCAWVISWEQASRAMLNGGAVGATDDEQA